MMTPFGPGSLYLTRTDIANGTPVNIGYVQEFSVDFDPETKFLYGQNQLPLAVARGTVKVTGKAKAAVLSGLAINTCMFGQSFTTGSLLFAQGEAGTIPATPFQVTAANTANFDKDLGVAYATTGLPLQLVASAPGTGQYAVSAAGIYTFAAADTGKAVLLNYTYKQASVGQSLVINNLAIGVTPTFQVDFVTINNSIPLVLRLYKGIVDKFGMAFKLTDFMMPDLQFNFAVNAANQLGTVYFGEVS